MYAITDDKVMNYVADYKVNLLAPYHMSEDEIKKFQSSLREVMLYIKYSKDKEQLKKVTHENEGFHHMERQAAEVLNVTTNSKIKFPENEEAVDMCKAIQDMMEESEERGIQIGEKRGIQAMILDNLEDGRDVDVIAHKLTKRFGLSEEDAFEHIYKVI